jgi:hypothetical protein
MASAQCFCDKCGSGGRFVSRGTWRNHGRVDRDTAKAMRQSKAKRQRTEMATGRLEPPQAFPSLSSHVAGDAPDDAEVALAIDPFGLAAQLAAAPVPACDSESDDSDASASDAERGHSPLLTAAECTLFLLDWMSSHKV